MRAYIWKCRYISSVYNKMLIHNSSSSSGWRVPSPHPQAANKTHVSEWVFSLLCHFLIYFWFLSYEASTTGKVWTKQVDEDWWRSLGDLLKWYLRTSQCMILRQMPLMGNLLEHKNTDERADQWRKLKHTHVLIHTYMNLSNLIHQFYLMWTKSFS